CRSPTLHPPERGTPITEPQPAKQNCPARSVDGQVKGKGGAKLKRVRIYSRGAPNQPATQGGSPWHSSRITVETARSDRGQHAHALRKNKEKRRRRLRCAKPSARQPKPRRMRSKRPGSLEGCWFRETPPLLCKECLCNRFRRRARQRPASARPAASFSTADLQ